MIEQRHSEQEFNKLFWEKRFFIESIVRRYARQSDLIDDLVQQIFLKIFLNMNKVRAAGNQNSYLYRIAVNEIIDYLRTNRSKLSVTSFTPELEAALPSMETAHEERLGLHQLLERVTGFLSSLPLKRKTVILLRAVEGKSFREISEIMGISEVSARNLYSIGLAAMKERINPQMEEHHE